MKRFVELCWKIEFVAFRIAALIGFMALLGFLLYLEGHHLLALVR